MRKFLRKWRYLACLIALLGFVLSPYQVMAATVTLFSDALTDSRPGNVTPILPNHDIKFKVDAGTTFANNETIAIKFTGFTVGSATLVQADFAVLWDADGAGSYTALTPTTDYTIATVTAGADKTVTIVLTTTGAAAIGSNKYIEVTFTNGANKLPNPAAGSYTIDIDASTFGDTGQVQVAIIEGVTTTATVSASLSVGVAGLNAGTVNAATITQTDTTATAINFATLTVNAHKIAAQTVTVSTNGAGGYTTTLRWIDGSGTTNGLVSGGSNNCDGFTYNSATNASPQAWIAGTNPTGSAANVDTCWYGYTTEDSTLAGTPDRFTTSGGDKWAPFSTTGYEVMYDSGPVNAQAIKIGYKVEANALQPQGVYNGTTEYISTGIF